jgi:hypothetical protein
MGDDPVESLREAIRRRGEHETTDEEQRFQALARNYLAAVRWLASLVQEVVQRIPELTLSLEEEEETFTSPAYPGRGQPIRNHRARISMGEDFLLFDPTASALGGAIGQVQISSSRPIPFLIEKTLYLIRSRDPQEREGTYWGYRSAQDMSAFAFPFTRDVLVKMLRAVFT